MTKLEEELENLKNENSRLTTQVKVLEKQVKALNMRLILERELAAKPRFDPASQMQISHQEMDAFIRQNIISQINAFEKK